jgi:hypothetical protein
MNPLPDRPAVMISSTSLDLPDHRKAVNDAIQRIGYFPLGMEQSSAQARPNALSFSIDLADRAHIYIGIFGYRYGYVPAESNPQGWSVTEHEYRRAVERGITTRSHVGNADVTVRPRITPRRVRRKRR